MLITEYLVSRENSNESLDSFISSPGQQLLENLDDAVQAPYCKNILLLLGI